MDGRSRAEGTGGKMRAGIDGSGGGGGVVYEARGYKQGWADERAGRQASWSTTQIEPKSRFTRDFGIEPKSRFTRDFGYRFNIYLDEYD